MSEPRYDVEVELVGHDGNVNNIIARVAAELRQKVSPAAATEFIEQATSSESYDAVLQLVIQTVHVTARPEPEDEDSEYDEDYDDEDYDDDEGEVR